MQLQKLYRVLNPATLSNGELSKGDIFRVINTVQDMWFDIKIVQGPNEGAEAVTCLNERLARNDIEEV